MSKSKTRITAQKSQRRGLGSNQYQSRPPSSRAPSWDPPHYYPKIRLLKKILGGHVATEEEKKEILLGGIPQEQMEAAVRAPGCPDWILDKYTRRTKISSYSKPITQLALRHPNCPQKNLIKLYASSDVDIRVAILSNPQCPAGLMVRGARGSYNERMAIINNPSAPEKAVRLLLAGKNNEIASAAMLHPNAPEHMRAIVVLAGEGPDTNWTS